MKSYAEIAGEVRSFIARALNMATEGVVEESVIADLSADSIQLFELLLAFEKEYEVETVYEDVVKLHTVRDVVEYVGRVKYGI